jgi:hypothetical protein
MRRINASGGSSTMLTIQYVQSSILSKVWIELNLPTLPIIFSAPGIVASRHAEVGAVPFCVV